MATAVYRHDTLGHCCCHLQALALVSDAGTPGISDPGAALISAALEAGQRVIPLPGPCAFVTGLVASGLATDSFTFHGFLPPKSGRRDSRKHACMYTCMHELLDPSGCPMALSAQVRGAKLSPGCQASQAPIFSMRRRTAWCLYCTIWQLCWAASGGHVLQGS